MKHRDRFQLFTHYIVFYLKNFGLYRHQFLDQHILLPSKLDFRKESSIRKKKVQMLRDEGRYFRRKDAQHCMDSQVFIHIRIIPK